MSTLKKIISIAIFSLLSLSCLQAQEFNILLTGDWSMYQYTARPQQDGNETMGERAVQTPPNVMPGIGAGFQILTKKNTFSLESSITYAPLSWHSNNLNGRGNLSIPVLFRAEFTDWHFMHVGVAAGVQFNKTEFHKKRSTGLSNNSPFFPTYVGEFSAGLNSYPWTDVYQQLDFFVRVGAGANKSFSAQVGIRYKHGFIVAIGPKPVI